MLALALLAVLPQGMTTIAFEDFEGPGFDWSTTLFSEVIGPGGATFFGRTPIFGNENAPDTSPPLPVNVDGDTEGRYAAPGGGSYALTPDIPSNQLTDSSISGFVGFGPFQCSSLDFSSAGFVLRATVDPNSLGLGVTGYSAILSNAPCSNVLLLDLYRWGSTTATTSTSLASATFRGEVSNENYALSLRARGNRLSTRVWRVVVDPQGLRLEPVVLNPGASGTAAYTLAATDDSFSSGRSGLYGATPQPLPSPDGSLGSSLGFGTQLQASTQHQSSTVVNRVYWDDVSIRLPTDSTLRRILLGGFAGDPPSSRNR